MLGRIIEIFSLPIMILNTVGVIIGGIWLAVLGKWGLIGIGILFLFISPLILSILMIPVLPIGRIAIKFYEKNNYLGLGHLFIFISQFYKNVLVVATCVIAFSVCSYYAGFHSIKMGIGSMPYLLWSWGMALGPWQILASDESDNEFSMITLFSASVFYLLFLISIFVSQFLTFIIFIIFVVIQLIVIPIFNIYIAGQMQE